MFFLIFDAGSFLEAFLTLKHDFSVGVYQTLKRTPFFSKLPDGVQIHDMVLKKA